ncbi:DNA mismatch repair protein MutS, partial [Enterococcus faecalis]|nr:DNA mismatch repair protein MutS [Enterococcus faecalis]
AFLLFRMGDFYELFYDDAVEAAQILELTLTSRNKNADNPIPMAGVPYHSAQAYIDTLVELGHKVAIAEQMEDPKTAVGVVKRAVVQVITPGTVADSSKLDSDNNFLIALDQIDGTYGLAYMDVVTGDFYVTEMADLASATGEIRNLRAREVVLGFDLDEEAQQVLSGQMNLLLSPQKEALIESPLIDQHLTVLEKQVAGKLLAYVARTQLRELSHLKPVRLYQVRDVLQMDYATKSSLDLLE